MVGSETPYLLVFNNLTRPIFFNIAIFGIGSPLPQLLVASNKVVDPQVFYVKLFVLSRPVKKIPIPKLYDDNSPFEKMEISENVIASDIAQCGGQ